MNGDKVVLDTNAVITLLRGNTSLADYLHRAEWIGISIISVLEYLSFSKMVESDRNLFREFLSRVSVVDLEIKNDSLIESVISLRKTLHLKLPDAIIAATAINYRAVLVTGDKVFQKIKGLEVRGF